MSRKGENITKRKDGRWEARAILARSETGKAMYSFFYGKTYAEAKAKKEYALSQVIMCIPKTPKNTLTVKDLIGEFLLHKKSAVKSSTLSHYENLIRTYIIDSLGNIKLMQLTATRIEKYSHSLLENGKKNGDGLSPKSVRDILSILRSIIKYGTSKQYLSSEILIFSMPRITPKETSILKPEEQSTLENYVTYGQDTYKFGVYLTLYTGLRIGELCSLRWSDINIERSTLTVRRTIQRIKVFGKKKTEIQIAEPKTRTSLRCIPLPTFLLSLLSSKKQSGDIYILTGTKNYIEPSNYYMRYKRWLKKINLPLYSFHALRHTFATRAIERGFDAKTLSEILGHSNVKITLDRYVHPSMDMKRAQMERLTPEQYQSNSVAVCVRI